MHAFTVLKVTRLSWVSGASFVLQVHVICLLEGMHQVYLKAAAPPESDSPLGGPTQHAGEHHQHASLLFRAGKARCPCAVFLGLELLALKLSPSLTELTSSRSSLHLEYLGI